MKNRILICTIGATPQVVTETVWALAAQRKPPWRPDHIHIITTTFALDRIRKALQSPDGPLARLMGAVPPPVTVHVPCRDGEPQKWSPGDDAAPVAGALKDVNTTEEAALMGNAILRLLAEKCQADTELHVSLAGGRKTMSAHALMALSLVGRPSDQASQVLVSEDYEDHPQFWHPDQDTWLARRGETELTLNPSLAVITLVPTPAPLLSHRIKNPGSLKDLDLFELIKLSNLAQALETDPHVGLDCSANLIIAGGVAKKFTAKDFAVYRLLATACMERWCGGRLTYDAIARETTPHGEAIDRTVSGFLAEAVSADGGFPDMDRSLKSWKDSCGARDPDIKREGIENNLASSFTRLEANLRAAFGPASPFLLWKITRGGARRFGLTIPPDRIHIT